MWFASGPLTVQVPAPMHFADPATYVVFPDVGRAVVGELVGQAIEVGGIGTDPVDQGPEGLLVHVGMLASPPYVRGLSGPARKSESRIERYVTRTENFYKQVI